MSLPCPICSRVIWHAVPKPIRETPMWHFASNTSAREEKNIFIWVGCPHAQVVSPQSSFVPDEQRKEIETKWDEAARKLFNRHTMPWSPPVRRAYGEALGFLTPPVEVQQEAPA